ncbi:MULTISPECIES: hypothetical protein [Micromonospora]|uniref:Uncharacterized protein n=1 Tax=Micromonospora solifontis TaxID=2487138 RepID=A0ABX9WKD5_9ACTN|nr:MULTISPECIES: hypothetical protein [Micromonospora]NES12424.1 hypothetical protein [Micromonospora sp. PPF5-17B]NES36340.1 hypothetical protein [Micromonospora solifontis]NES57814.1 hypothetical protein [Micromonospora sp. PPF5-6]RNL99581.1 hypothetical protein EFE23_09205 [Micromonospora solifontis]
MRRVFAVTALTGLLLAGAGCADRDSDPFAVGFASPAPRATPAPTATGDAGVCAGAKQAGSAAVQTYVQKLAEMLRANALRDRRTEEAARREAEAALAGWRDTLREQSARAADPRLRTLLADLATEVGGLGTDVRAIDETEFDRLQGRLDELCPG